MFFNLNYYFFRSCKQLLVLKECILYIKIYVIPLYTLKFRSNKTSERSLKNCRILTRKRLDIKSFTFLFIYLTFLRTKM